MKRLRSLSISRCLCLLAGLSALPAFAAEQPAFRAGAARVDITPAQDAALLMAGYPDRPQPFQKIHDNIYVRAIVLDDGTTRAALLTWELIGIPNSVWDELSDRIARESGIPRDNILISAVHDHAAPALPSPRPPSAGETARAPDPNAAAYLKKVTDAAVQAVLAAKAKLQPARIGFGTATADVNINRRELTPKGEWWLGYNPDGPSDKTVAVVKFETLSGKPIAFFINYAVHGVVMGPHNLQISGDLPGACSRYVEAFYAGAKAAGGRSDAGWELRQRPDGGNPDVVAVWTSGAAGDQNPVSMAETDFSMVDALGRILGEQVVRAVSHMKATIPEKVFASQRVVTCPGQRIRPVPHSNNEYTFNASDPVSIRLSLLMVGNVAFCGVSGEAFTLIGERLKKESPFNDTMMVTHTNGSSGYIPNDQAYGQISYEITTTHLKAGCAEGSIVDGFVEMMNQVR